MAVVKLLGALAALGTTYAFPADWIITDLAPLLMARMDPIINPGEPGGHNHIIFGSSNFRSVLNTPEEQLNADCSSAMIQPDKSNYWQPNVYLINDDNEYEAILGDSRVYYRAEGAQPWPQGMRMLSGLGNVRDPESKQAMGVLYSATPPGGSERDNGKFLPNGTSFPEGISGLGAAVITPSCGWANQSLDSADHFSHLTWPIGQGGGIVWSEPHETECPPSHPIRYPALFFQVIYSLTERQVDIFKRKTAAGQNALILSNGDTTGNTLHADFVNGWDPKILQDAINQCTGSNSVADQPQNCPVFAPHMKKWAGDSCRHQGMIPDEEVGLVKALKNLPGCNPRWDYEMGPTKPKDCPWHKQPGWTAPNALYSQWLSGKAVPIAAQGLEKELTIDDQLPAVAGIRGFITHFPVVGRGGNGTWPFASGETTNPDGVQTGTNADVADNLDMATAKNKIDTVKGMKDTTAWTQVDFQGTPTTNYRILKDLYSVSFTMLGPEVRTDASWIQYFQTKNPDQGVAQAGPTGGDGNAQHLTEAAGGGGGSAQATPTPAANAGATDAQSTSAPASSTSSKGPDGGALVADKAPVAGLDDWYQGSSSGSASSSASPSATPTPGAETNNLAEENKGGEGSKGGDEGKGGEGSSAAASSTDKAAPATTKKCKSKARRRRSHI